MSDQGYESVDSDEGVDFDPPPMPTLPKELRDANVKYVGAKQFVDEINRQIEDEQIGDDEELDDYVFRPDPVQERERVRMEEEKMARLRETLEQAKTSARITYAPTPLPDRKLEEDQKRIQSEIEKEAAVQRLLDEAKKRVDDQARQRLSEWREEQNEDDLA